MTIIVIFRFLGQWHCCGTLQCYLVCPPTCGKHWWDFLHWQRGSLWHLFPYLKIDHPHLWWLEPFGLSYYVWSHHLPQVPRSTQRWPQKIGRQHGALPQVALFHAWLCSFDLSWQPAIQVNIPFLRCLLYFSNRQISILNAHFAKYWSNHAD